MSTSQRAAFHASVFLALFVLSAGVMCGSDLGVALASSFESACAVEPEGTGEKEASPANRETGDPACRCGASPRHLRFTSGVPTGRCGSVEDGDGKHLRDLVCGGLYAGGGRSLVPPGLIPDGAVSVTNVVACEGARLTVAGASPQQAGSDRRCTTKGCLFGAPMPVPSPTIPWLSKCIVNVLAEDARGTADCTTGAATLELALTANIHLTGDLLDVPGTQPCPLCTSGLCHGGSRDRLPCTPETSELGFAYPTSQDCPPDPAQLVETVTRTLALTTQTKRVAGARTAEQAAVFCGFCRDSDDSLCFAGDPGDGCPTPAREVMPCRSDADCAQPFESCRQRSSGAFGLLEAASVMVHGLTPTNLADGEPHELTLVEASCIPPTFNRMIDLALDLPGPAAGALTGTVQLLR